MSEQQAPPSEATKHEAWTAATVAVILHLRTWAIRSGTSPLTAWDTVSERVRLATRQATSVPAWVSTIQRTLRIGTVDSATAALFIELGGVVGPDVDVWLDWVRDEHQFLFALAREQADRKKEAGSAAGQSTPKASGRKKPKAKEQTNV